LKKRGEDCRRHGRKNLAECKKEREEVGRGNLPKVGIILSKARKKLKSN
jgi:hypothetical protein